MIGCLSFNSLGGQSDISIHTSVKQATGNVPGKGSPPYIFQSTPPQRRRRQHSSPKTMSRLFQSTPPQRRRQNSGESRHEQGNFNPRLRKGGDFPITALFHRQMISIHASAKEATSNSEMPAPMSLFQSTPPQRRRHCVAFRSRQAYRFQSTPPQRRRPSFVPWCAYFSTFQSTPPQRRRLISPFFSVLCYTISIHASAKEATATYCDISAIMYISSLNNFFFRYF